jgi:hypothetical protein
MPAQRPPPTGVDERGLVQTSPAGIKGGDKGGHESRLAIMGYRSVRHGDTELAINGPAIAVVR